MHAYIMSLVIHLDSLFFVTENLKAKLTSQLCLVY